MLTHEKAVGCIAGPQLWKDKAAPRYFEGVVTAIVDWCLFIAVVAAYWALCYWENRKRDRESIPDNIRQFDTTDVTDREDRLFRYSY